MNAPERQSKPRLQPPKQGLSRVRETSKPLRKFQMRWLVSRLALVGVSTLIALFAVEIFFRAKFPFRDATWPAEFDARVGFRFVPGETVQWSNFLDYATTTKVNSLGFLDREPAPVADDEFRIVVLGDSFVEAAQVPVEQKFHILLESQLQAALPNRKFRTSAFGYSGCGTANVIPFYDEYAHAQQPDLVLLVFVSNDLANNSPVLESIRNGWHPHKPPRMFYEQRGDGAVEIPIDPNWNDSLLPVEPAQAAPPMWGSSLFGWSRTYAFIAANVRHRNASMAHLELYAKRAEAIRNLGPKFASLLEGFDPRADNLDTTFFAEELPPAFAAAVDLTAHSLEQLSIRAKRDGARVAVLIHEGCSGARSLPEGRKAIPDAYRDRVIEAANRAGCKHLDLAKVVDARGERADASFPHDGHWSPKGHAWVADGVTEFLLENQDDLLSADKR